MKIANLFNILFVAMLMLSSCDNDVTVETTVNEDGSIDKMITLYRSDSTKNATFDQTFGVSEARGWTKVIARTNDEVANDSSIKISGAKTAEAGTSSEQYQITYTKVFPSSDAINEEMAIYTDTTLQVTTKFEKCFRWFYTYLYYSETYHPVNKLKLPISNYVTPEDSIFIERLPGEGEKISKSDSIQLSILNDKLFEKYGTPAIMDEYLEIMIGLMHSQNIDKRWDDTLQMHKRALFERMLKEQNIEGDYLPNKMDSLGIPLDYTIARKEFAFKSKKLERKLSFISWAADGKYRNIVNMPWEVIQTNADSINGNRLTWNPPVMKFLFKKHTLHATSRKMNYWAVVVSALAIVFTIILFIRKRRA